MRGRLKHRGTEARRKKEGGGEGERGRGWCEGGLSVDSVALCFYSPDRCADGGNTEAQRHRGTEIGKGREGDRGEIEG